MIVFTWQALTRIKLHVNFIYRTNTYTTYSTNVIFTFTLTLYLLLTLLILTLFIHALVTIHILHCVLWQDKWVQMNLMLGVTLWWTSISSRGSRNTVLLVASCYRNLDKLSPDGPLALYADLTYLYLYVKRGRPVKKNSLPEWLTCKSLLKLD